MNIFLDFWYVLHIPALNTCMKDATVQETQFYVVWFTFGFNLYVCIEYYRLTLWETTVIAKLQINLHQVIASMKIVLVMIANWIAIIISNALFVIIRYKFLLHSFQLRCCIELYKDFASIQTLFACTTNTAHFFMEFEYSLKKN